MNQSDFLDDLYNNRSEIFPHFPRQGQMHMDLNGRLYVFLEGSWAEVEDIKLEFNDDEGIGSFDNIIDQLGIEL